MFSPHDEGFRVRDEDECDCSQYELVFIVSECDEKTSPRFKAALRGAFSHKYVGTGESMAEALGNLIIEHSDALGITIERARNK